LTSRELPDVGFVDGDGRAASLADFRGRVVLLNLWATWCVPCRREMPALERLQAKLGGAEFIVLPLSIDRGGVPPVKRFYEELGLAALGVFVDQSGAATGKLATTGVPTTLLIDREGARSGGCSVPPSGQPRRDRAHSSLSQLPVRGRQRANRVQDMTCLARVRAERWPNGVVDLGAGAPTDRLRSAVAGSAGRSCMPRRFRRHAGAIPAGAHSLKNLEEELYRRESISRSSTGPHRSLLSRTPTECMDLDGLREGRGPELHLCRLPGCLSLHTELIARLQTMIKLTPMHDHVQFVSITTDPAHDTSEVLKAYGLTHGSIQATGLPDDASGQPEDATRQLAERFGHKFTPRQR